MSRSSDKHRGVSSTAKLPVSKTGLGGSNPSAPARIRMRPFSRVGANRGAQVPRRQRKPPRDDRKKVKAREAPETGMQMAKSTAMELPGDDSLASRLKAWPQRAKSFYNDVRTEMKKVTTPSRKEVQGTTTVVIITVFLFGFYFWVIDSIIGKSLDQLLKRLAHS